MMAKQSPKNISRLRNGKIPTITKGGERLKAFFHLSTIKWKKPLTSKIATPQKILQLAKRFDSS
jgi:hypothetical protein